MDKYNFKVEAVVSECVTWIRDWFARKNENSNAVIGMSGGKDSTVAAALLVKALGPERVIGVAMPDKGQGINDADKICKYLGITYMCAPIDAITDAFHNELIADETGEFCTAIWSEQTEQNIPPRIRMTMLYAIAQTHQGFPVNTCNLSEDYIGYATLFGDSAGSFSPISGLTVSEIYAIGDYLGLPKEWVHKTPDDGLPHSCSDEEKFGFTYAELDELIRMGKEPEGYCTNNSDELKAAKIQRMHKWNRFKTEIIQVPHYSPSYYYIYE